MTVIDSDQHLVEYRGLWHDHVDPADRDLAIELVDDELGWTRLMWHGRTLGLAEVQEPGRTAAIGARHELWRAAASPTPSPMTRPCRPTTGSPLPIAWPGSGWTVPSCSPTTACSGTAAVRLAAGPAGQHGRLATAGARRS